MLSGGLNNEAYRVYKLSCRLSSLGKIFRKGNDEKPTRSCYNDENRHWIGE